MLMETAIDPLSTGLAGAMLVLVTSASAGASQMQKEDGHRISVTDARLRLAHYGRIGGAANILKCLKPPSVVADERMTLGGRPVGRIRDRDRAECCAADDDDAVAALESLLSEPDATRGAQVRAIRVLGRIGTPTAIACLKRLH